MSRLLNNLQVEFDKLYDSDLPDGSNLHKCLQETHEFKTQLRKLKAHLNKNIQEWESVQEKEQESNVNKKAISEEKDRINKKHTIIQDKLNKSHNQWDHSIRKQSKIVSQQYSRFKRNSLNHLKDFKLDDIYKNKICDDKKKNVLQAIGFHVSRYNIGELSDNKGNDMSRYLNDIYGISDETTENFILMGEIVHDLKAYKFESCMKWYHEQDNLYKNPRLLLELYTLKGLYLVKHANITEIFDFFVNEAPRDIMDIDKYDYCKISADLMVKTLQSNIMDEIDYILAERLQSCISLFMKEFCLQNGLPLDSPLFLIVLSGIISFQYFIKYNQIRALSHVGWTTQDELPFDVELPDFLSHFHPVFICPVLKEETTEENPPYSLACHHIISKKALDRLSKNGSLSFKCPYCPVHTTMIKTRKVKFVML